MQDWELESLAYFMELIYSLSMSGLGDDKTYWGAGSVKVFTVKDYKRSLTLSSSPTRVFPWKSIWKAKVPPRVAFFFWTAALGKILTVDNLRKRGLILVEWCCLCKQSGEVSITCCCIALMCRNIGPWFLAFLGSNGLCLIVFGLFLIAGKGVSGITNVLGFGD
jgi:hypothetical protein